MNPVSEMAFGVSRDSISRSRISSWVVGPSPGGCDALPGRPRPWPEGSAVPSLTKAMAPPLLPNAHTSGRARASSTAGEQRRRRRR